MKRIAILGLALVAVLALAVVGASAKAPVLTLKTAKGPLAAGAKISEFSSNLITVTKTGTLECEKSTINAQLTTNGATKDKGSATEDLEEGNYEGIKGACKTSLGPAKITASGFPWPLVLSAKGTGEIKGTKKVKFSSEFLGGPAKGIVCPFEASKIKFALVTSGPVKLTVTNQKFKLAKGSNAACPKEGLLSGEFNMTSGGETVEA